MFGERGEAKHSVARRLVLIFLVVSLSENLFVPSSGADVLPENFLGNAQLPKVVVPLLGSPSSAAAASVGDCVIGGTTSGLTFVGWEWIYPGNGWVSKGKHDGEFDGNAQYCLHRTNVVLSAGVRYVFLFWEFMDVQNDLDGDGACGIGGACLAGDSVAHQQSGGSDTDSQDVTVSTIVGTPSTFMDWTPKSTPLCDGASDTITYTLGGSGSGISASITWTKTIRDFCQWAVTQPSGTGGVVRWVGQVGQDKHGKTTLDAYYGVVQRWQVSSDHGTLEAKIRWHSCEAFEHHSISHDWHKYCDATDPIITRSVSF